MEIWKDVINYEGLYQVSNLGRIKGLKRTTTDKRVIKEKILKPSLINNEYVRVSLCYRNIKKTKLLHILIAQSFLNHNSNKGKIVVDHINNNKHDNRLCNLQIINISENNSKDKKPKSGYNYIYYREKDKKYIVQKTKLNKNRYIGCFKNIEDAIYALDKTK